MTAMAHVFKSIFLILETVQKCFCIEENNPVLKMLESISYWKLNLTNN